MRACVLTRYLTESVSRLTVCRTYAVPYGDNIQADAAQDDAAKASGTEAGATVDAATSADPAWDALQARFAALKKVP